MRIYLTKNLASSDFKDFLYFMYYSSFSIIAANQSHSHWPAKLNFRQVNLLRYELSIVCSRSLGSVWGRGGKLNLTRLVCSLRLSDAWRVLIWIPVDGVCGGGTKPVSVAALLLYFITLDSTRATMNKRHSDPRLDTTSTMSNVAVSVVSLCQLIIVNVTLVPTRRACHTIPRVIITSSFSLFTTIMDECQMLTTEIETVITMLCDDN